MPSTRIVGRLTTRIPIAGYLPYHPYDLFRCHDVVAGSGINRGFFQVDHGIPTKYPVGSFCVTRGGRWVLLRVKEVHFDHGAQEQESILALNQLFKTPAPQARISLEALQEVFLACGKTSC